MKVWNNNFLLWGVVTVVILVTAVNNGTIIFDDLYLLKGFDVSTKENGVFTTLYILLFNIDLGHYEFRLYGLSRVFHYLLWFVFGNSATCYTLFIAISQLLTGLLISKLLVHLRYPRIQAVSIGLIWALSPFSVTSCFHFYTYLILPWQLAIISALLLSLSIPTSVILRRSIFVVLGISIGLTGESHLIASSVLLFLVAISSTTSNTRLIRLFESCIIVLSTLVTIVSYKLVRDQLIPTQGEFHRYNFSIPSVEEFSRTSLLFLKSITAGISDQVFPVVSIAGGWVFVSFLFALIVTLLIRPKTKKIKSEQNFRLPVVIVLLFICSLMVVFALNIFTNADSPFLTRRYGFIPYTLGMIAIISFFSEPLVFKRLKVLSIIVIIIPVWFWMTIQIVALPIIRSEDNHIWRSITKAMEGKTSPVLLFVNEWYRHSYSDPNFVPNLGTIGLRGAIPEIFESSLGHFWWQSQYATQFTRAKFAGGSIIESAENEKVRLVGNGILHPGSIEIDTKQIVTVLNTSPTWPPWETAILTIKVFPDWKDYKLHSNL